MSKSVRVLGMGVVEVILAALVILMIGMFSIQQVMEEITVNQQLSNFYKFKAQVVSICDMVKINPNLLQVSGREYVTLYPFYDIRFYNQTGSMPPEVANVCRGDKCACLIQTRNIDNYNQYQCISAPLDTRVQCWYNYVPVESVLSCFNMQELGCNNQIWFSKGVLAPMREYKVGLSNTCKTEGVVTWDRTDFAYDKLSEVCVDPETSEVVIDIPEGYCDTGCI